MDSANLAGGGFRKLARIHDKVNKFGCGRASNRRIFLTALRYFFLTQKSPRSFWGIILLIGDATI